MEASCLYLTITGISKVVHIKYKLMKCIYLEPFFFLMIFW